jgi:hypothetical protein
VNRKSIRYYFIGLIALALTVVDSGFRTTREALGDRNPAALILASGRADRRCNPR